VSGIVVAVNNLDRQIKGGLQSIQMVFQDLQIFYRTALTNVGVASVIESSNRWHSRGRASIKSFKRILDLAVIISSDGAHHRVHLDR
jgi:hypothetical protein